MKGRFSEQARQRSFVQHLITHVDLDAERSLLPLLPLTVQAVHAVCACTRWRPHAARFTESGSEGASVCAPTVVSFYAAQLQFGHSLAHTAPPVYAKPW